MLTQKLLKEFLHYNPETGVFTWLQKSRAHFRSDGNWKAWNSRRVGTEAGSVENTGYIRIGIFDKRYQAHRLAFLWVSGELPCEEVDHINGVRNDNRWANLRTVSRLENCKNRALSNNNKSGISGVGWYAPYHKWFAKIGVNGKERHLGYFDSKKEAAAKRKEAEVALGYHSNSGRIPLMHYPRGHTATRCPIK